MDIIYLQKKTIIITTTGKNIYIYKLPPSVVLIILECCEFTFQAVDKKHTAGKSCGDSQIRG